MRKRFLLALVFLAFIAAGVTELKAVTGPGPTPPENPEGNTGALKSQVQTGGSYDAHSGNATRVVNDLHVPGALLSVGDVCIGLGIGWLAYSTMRRRPEDADESHPPSMGMEY